MQERPACARCGRTDLPLVLAEGGQVCGICEAEEAEEQALDTALWGAVAAPIVLLALAAVLVFAGCVPLFGLFLAPFGGLVAIGAMVAGVRNFLITGVEGPQRTALVLSGAIGVLLGLPILPASFFLFLAAVQQL